MTPGIALGIAAGTVLMDGDGAIVGDGTGDGTLGPGVPVGTEVGMAAGTAGDIALTAIGMLITDVAQADAEATEACGPGVVAADAQQPLDVVQAEASTATTVASAVPHVAQFPVTITLQATIHVASVVTNVTTADAKVSRITDAPLAAVMARTAILTPVLTNPATLPAAHVSKRLREAAVQAVAATDAAKAVRHHANTTMRLQAPHLHAATTAAVHPAAAIVPVLPAAVSAAVLQDVATVPAEVSAAEVAVEDSEVAAVAVEVADKNYPPTPYYI